MKGIQQYIQSVMTGERTPGVLPGFLLMALTMLYGAIVRIRGALYDHGVLQSHALPCKVISVGNLTVGGTGKTPMTIYLANLLRDSGSRPAVISRGYKGGAEKTGKIVSDRENVLTGPDAAGDEPFMMAQNLKGIPVLVGADRFAVGMKAVALFNPDVVIVDDGFQHRRLKRDLDIVLMDDHSFLGNGYMLPRGVLREPVSGLARADLFVLTRCQADSITSLNRLSEMAPGKPVFTSFHEPYVVGIHQGTGQDPESDGIDAKQDVQNFDFLKKHNAFVFSGIAKNDEFQKTVAGIAGKVAGALGFDDHHRYTQTDFDQIIRQAKHCSATCLVTTEKDYVKIAATIRSPLDIVVLGIRIAFREDEAAFANFIKKRFMVTNHHCVSK